MQFFGLSDRGRVRENNEDMLCLEPEIGAVVLADGMGGERCGEVASAMAVETAVHVLRNRVAELPVETRLREAVREANTTVFACSREKAACRGMGTTLVVAQCEGDRLHVASVGDSRAYLFRAGTLRQLTQDQTVYQELRQGLGLTHEEAARYPNSRALTAAVGVSPDVAMRTCSESLQPGDTVLVCSDGLYGPVKEGDIAMLMGQIGDLNRLGERLVSEANSRGGPDNITLALMRVST